MQQSYTLEIVPLQRTETGLRLRSDFMNAEEYDVVLREDGAFRWRRPADSLIEAGCLVAEAQAEYGEALTFEGEVPQWDLEEVPQHGLSL